MKKSLLILALLGISALAAFAQTESRLIKMDKLDEADDDEIYLEMTSLKINNSEIFLNESFNTDENWLKDLKIKVRNVSGKPMTCVSVGFGLLEGIDEKLEPQMSWGYGLSLFKGDCSESKEKSGGKFLS